MFRLFVDTSIQPCEYSGQLWLNDGVSASDGVKEGCDHPGRPIGPLEPVRGLGAPPHVRFDSAR